MSSHWNSGSGSQNVGNVIGTKSSIRQSRLFREYESGNAVKGLLGQSSLQWNVNKKEGAYSGPVYDSSLVHKDGFYDNTIYSNDKLDTDNKNTTRLNRLSQKRISATTDEAKPDSFYSSKSKSNDKKSFKAPSWWG